MGAVLYSVFQSGVGSTFLPSEPANRDPPRPHPTIVPDPFIVTGEKGKSEK